MKNVNEDIILEFKHISKHFPGVKALDDISFKVKRGSIHCLIGENGAGKSTLMAGILNSIVKYGALKVVRRPAYRESL